MYLCYPKLQSISNVEIEGLSQQVPVKFSWGGH